MEFISDSLALTNTFKSLCGKYCHYKWSVAWAGDPKGFDLFSILNHYRKKIDKIVVGLHFYQTHPDFIESFMGDERVKFYMQSDGTFHTKVYLFYNSDKDWSAIVGSSNFTQHGFHRNEEANLLISSKDLGADFSSISDMIDSLWTKGGYFNKKDLEVYTETFKLQTKKHASLKHLKPVTGSSVSSSLDVMTWDEYFHTIVRTDFDTFNARISLLKNAHSLFKSGLSFNSFHSDVKRALAGFIVNSDELDAPGIDWRLFGSMMGAGAFKKAINSGSAIGSALDMIPLKGNITKTMFQAYCNAFNKWSNPIACATRLLAIKRPDFFVCVNSKNRKILSQLLDIPQSQFTLENYWDILMRIHSSEWFNDTAPLVSGIEKDIKNFQVAMLDSISYTH